MNTKKQYITVKALINVDGKILFLKEHKGNWELPGGKIDFGESPQDALKRELYEEVGFKDIIINGILDAWSFNVLKEGNEYQFIVIVFNCSIKDFEIKTSDEHLEYKWISPNQIIDYEMKDGYLRLFTDINKKIVRNLSKFHE